NPPLVKPKGPECKCTASPNYIRDGIYTMSETDLQLPAFGTALNVTRIYLSNRAADGPLGKGWSLNVGARIFYSTFLFAAPNTTRTLANLTFSNGQTFQFTQNPDGSFSPPLLRKDVLVRNGDGSFDLTIERSRISYHFGPEGSLRQVTDENGNVQALTYDG